MLCLKCVTIVELQLHSFAYYYICRGCVGKRRSIILVTCALQRLLFPGFFVWASRLWLSPVFDLDCMLRNEVSGWILMMGRCLLNSLVLAKMLCFKRPLERAIAAVGFVYSLPSSAPFRSQKVEKILKIQYLDILDFSKFWCKGSFFFFWRQNV